MELQVSGQRFRAGAGGATPEQLLLELCLGAGGSGHGSSLERTCPQRQVVVMNRKMFVLLLKCHSVGAVAEAFTTHGGPRWPLEFPSLKKSWLLTRPGCTI